MVPPANIHLAMSCGLKKHSCSQGGNWKSLGLTMILDAKNALRESVLAMGNRFVNLQNITILLPYVFFSRGPQLLALGERLTNPLRHTAFCSVLKRTQTWLLLRPVLSQPNCSASPDWAQQFHSPQSLRSCARLIPRFSHALQNCCVHPSLHTQWEWAFL